MKNTNGMGYGEGQWANTSRQVVGDSIYHDKVDAPSASEFRSGMLTHKEGVDKQSVMDPTSQRGHVMQDSLGARYAPQITHRPGFVESAETQASGRIVPAVMGRRAFEAQ